MNQHPYMEVWGDTVKREHLAWSVIIGIVISIGCFLLANRFLQNAVAKPEMARAYAMLFGLAGCLIAGAVCAKLFKPKREVLEDKVDVAAREEVLRQMELETGDLGRVADLPPMVINELKDLALYDLFVAHEAAKNTAPASANNKEGKI